MQPISRAAIISDRVLIKPTSYFGRFSFIFCLVAMAALLLVTPASFGDAPQPAVPFHFVRGFAVVVPVSVNGHGPYDFMLDTGTTITTIDRGLASDLALVTRAHGTAVTLSENVPAAIAVVDRLAFGPIEEHGAAVMVRDLNGLRNLVPTARGVLGQNALLHADFMLDYRHKLIEFDRDGDLLRSLGGHHVPLRRQGEPSNPQFSNLVVHANISSDGAHPMDLLLDSGAASMVLFGSLGDTGIADREGFVVDTAGRQRMAGIKQLQLTIDGKTRDLLSHVLSFRAAGPGIDGLLPTSLFDRIYISNSGTFAIFEPKIKKERAQDHMLAGLGSQPVPHGPKS
jgi:hypothetical protein